MRASILTLLALAACRVTEAPAEPRAETPPVPEMRAAADTTQTRAAAAGLSEAQAAELNALDAPVYVPFLPAGWTFARMEPVMLQSDLPATEYVLHYRTPRGACLMLIGAYEGLGDVFAQPPPHARDLVLEAVAAVPTTSIGWSDADDTTEGWDGGRVATEWAEADGYWLSVQSDAACAAPRLADAEALLASLRPLDPNDDAVLIGAVDFEEAVGEVGLPRGRDPEALALTVFGPQEVGEGQQTRVETLRHRRRVAVTLVTTTNLPDDSVRDERVRVVLVQTESEWEVWSAGRQYRCQPGRGHTEWSASACA